MVDLLVDVSIASQRAAPLVHEVISGAVNGGLVNPYPRLAEGSEMDAGRGRLIPRQGAQLRGEELELVDEGFQMK